ncbi:hypothetical protein JCM11641_003483 [Rhodosporidiobolus odoratus]
MASPTHPSRPLPRFTTTQLRPSRAPLPPTSHALSSSSRPARKESPRRQGRPSQGIAMDGRGAYLEAALENRRLNGVGAPVLRERQPGAGHEQPQPTGNREYEDVDSFADAYAGEVGSWEEENPQATETLSAEQEQAAVQTGPSGANLSRMTSTRRYLCELDPDDDFEALQEGDRSTWHSGYDTEARGSVASLQPPGARRDNVPRDSAISAMTTGSMDGDPFSYSAYESFPPPSSHGYFHQDDPEPLPPPLPSVPAQHRPLPRLASNPVPSAGEPSPVLHIGPSSPTTEAYLQNLHDSALWSEITSPFGPPPAHTAPRAPQPLSPPQTSLPSSPSQSGSRTRSPNLSSAKNFSRPFVPPLPSAHPPTAAPPRRHGPQPKPSSSADSHERDLERSSSLGHDSTAEHLSSLGHSSSVGHSTQSGDSLSSSWEDRQMVGFRQQEEAKRAIALARSKSQRAMADRREERERQETGVEELRDERTVPPISTTADHTPPHLMSESATAIHFAHPSSPPASASSPIHPPSAEYQGHDHAYDHNAQYLVAPSTSSGGFGPPSPLSNPRPSPQPPLLASTPISIPNTPSSPPTAGFLSRSAGSQHSSPPSPSQQRQRNVLRKPRRPSTGDSRHDAPSFAQPMNRSPSAASSVASNSSSTGGAWCRFRARSKSRSGTDQRPDTSTLRPPLPAISAPIYHDLPSSSTALASTSIPAFSSPLSASGPTPLSKADFTRLAATRPAFLRAKTDVNEAVFKSVAGAHTVQAGLVSGDPSAARGRVLVNGEEEFEHLSEAGGSLLPPSRPGGMARSASDQGPQLHRPHHHQREGSAVPSLYSQYSYYDLPDSPQPGSRQPSPLAASSFSAQQTGLRTTTTTAAVKFGAGGGGGAGVNRASSTMEKLGAATSAGRSRLEEVERTASGREVRREPTSAEDFLQVGINLHENGELGRAAWCFEQSAKKDGGCGAGMLMYGLTLRHGWERFCHLFQFNDTVADAICAEQGCAINAGLGFRYLQKAAESVVEDLDRVVFGGRTLSEAEANTKAAKSELVLALHEMGVSYRFGWGVAKDKKLAVSYFKLAADLGDLDAQQDVAFMYANGKGVKKKNVKVAAHYYRLAIKQGASDFGLSWVWKKKYESDQE